MIIRLVLIVLALLLPTTSCAASKYSDAAKIFSELMSESKMSDISPLKGGVSESGLYKIITDKGTYVLRILSPSMPEKSTKFEFEVSRQMGELGISPKVYASSIEKKALVIEAIDGGPIWGPLSNEQLHLLGEKLVKMQQAPMKPDTRRSSPLKLVNIIVRELDIALPKDHQQIFDRLAPDFKNLESGNYVLSHTDLNPGNLLKRGNDIKIIDWEDACVSHPYVDLAGLLAFYNPKPAEADKLLHAYTKASGVALNRKVLNSAYKVYVFSIALKLLRTAVRLGVDLQNTPLGTMATMKPLFEKRDWKAMLAKLTDKDAAYALSLLFLEESKHEPKVLLPI